jgi:hypothetical protein
VLLIEDSADDSGCWRELGKAGFSPQTMRVRPRPSSDTRGDWDLVLSDYSLPAFDLQALQQTGHAVSTSR